MKKSITLFLFLMLASAMVSHAQVIIPYYLPGPDYVRITVEPGQPGETTTASVSIMLPDSCVGVSRWGDVIVNENRFYIDVETVTLFGVACLQVIGSASNDYVLGELEEGEYVVIVTNYGDPLRTATFFVGETPVETPNPTPLPTPTETPVDYECGDFNENGKVDIIDALLIAQAYVGLITGNTELGDVNNDGDLDIIDALLVAQYYVGTLESLDCGTGTID